MEVKDLSKPLWELKDFPNFYANTRVLQQPEQDIQGAAQSLHNSPLDLTELKVQEVYFNSEIEGIILNPESILSSYKNNLSGRDKVPKEQGAVQLLELAIQNQANDLSHDLLYEMNTVILQSHPEEIVRERSGKYVGDMVIIKGGSLDVEVISDRGVPADNVQAEMDRFLTWFNQRDPAVPIQNAIQGHLHFEKIHPFIDGNGRVGRAIMNMGLMRDLGLDSPLALSKVIQRHRKQYYESFRLETLDLTATVNSLSPMIFEMVQETHKIQQLTILRSKGHQADLNQRQLKALEKVISAELKDEFKGHLSNQKYRKLAGISESKMAQRDLSSLVEKALLRKTGVLKGTHYELNIPAFPAHG